MEIKVNLNEFLENVYSIDVDTRFDYEEFNFDGGNQLQTSNYDELFNEIKEKYGEMLEDDCITCNECRNRELKHTINDIIDSCTLEYYENTYISEYTQEFKRQLNDKIETDFKNLRKFDETYKIEVLEISFDKNIIVFQLENIDIFANFEIECINGYGNFEYKDLQEFYELNIAKSQDAKIKCIIGHLHHLAKFEDIFATIFNMFQFDEGFVDYYGTLGSYEIDINNIDEYIKENY